MGTDRSLGSPGLRRRRALGVPIDASAAEVKQAYRKTLLLWHPDKLEAQSGGDAARFRAAQEAWEMLGSETMRRVYDCGALPRREKPAVVPEPQPASEGSGQPGSGSMDVANWSYYPWLPWVPAMNPSRGASQGRRHYAGSVNYTSGRSPTGFGTAAEEQPSR
eukprot:Skav218337  [mRNA]  locus=scaffold755:448848:466646:+ [translate_table: standard]